MDVVYLLEIADGVSCFAAASGIGSHIWRQCHKLGQKGRSTNVSGLFYSDAVVSCADNYSLAMLLVHCVFTLLISLSLDVLYHVAADKHSK